MSICSQFYLVYSIFFAISCVKTNKLPFCQIISIYALLAEGDLLEGYGNDNPGAFQSTPSSRRATNQDKLYNLINPISIHALLTEGDRTSIAFFSTFPLFQSTPSSRRATYYEARMRAAKYNISIHALLTEGDVDPVGRQAQLPPISIHALLTEGDRIHTGKTTCNIEFQSTPSSRRATSFRSGELCSLSISIHALLTEGDQNVKFASSLLVDISIHALLTEGDSKNDKFIFF